MVVRVLIGIRVETNVAANEILVLDLEENAVVVRGVLEEPLVDSCSDLGIQSHNGIHGVLRSESLYLEASQYREGCCCLANDRHHLMKSTR